VLVGTDVIGRGLDVPAVDTVIQVFPPAKELINYIHRSGRTGRANAPGNSLLYLRIQSSNKAHRTIHFIVHPRSIAYRPQTGKQIWYTLQGEVKLCPKYAKTLRSTAPISTNSRAAIPISNGNSRKGKVQAPVRT